MVISIAHAADDSPTLLIMDILRRAENTSPELKAAVERENQARETIKIFQSAYYPDLNLEGIDSTGFPGSTSALGVQGIMGSPFRKGPAAGVVSKLTLYDFGRTRYGVASARQELYAAEQERKILRFRIYQTALRAYFDACRFRNQQETWLNLEGEIAQVTKEVDRFVKTGQRTVVERYLVQDQEEEADTTQAAYGERYRVSLHRLALLTGLDEHQMAAPLLHPLSEQVYAGLRQEPESPLLTAAAANVDVARDLAQQAKAENWPVLSAMGSAGDVNEARLVTKRDYSVGVGVVLPVFEGFRTQSEVHRAESIRAENENTLAATRLELDEANAQYDEIIDSSKVQLQHLEHELTVATEALRVAKQRYFYYQGTLVDVREAVRNISRVQTDIINVKADLLLAIGLKAVLNGAFVS
jgi:outer membrane protein